jgi:hypothetical protein
MNPLHIHWNSVIAFTSRPYLTNGCPTQIFEEPIACTAHFLQASYVSCSYDVPATDQPNIIWLREH